MAARATDIKDRRHQAAIQALQRVSPEAKVLYSYLASQCFGASRAETAEKIAARLNIPRRHLHDLVRELRLAGIPVCSSCSDEPGMGYFIPRSREEAEPTRRQLESRFKAIAAVHSRFNQALDAWFGPPQLFEL